MEEAEGPTKGLSDNLYGHGCQYIISDAWSPGSRKARMRTHSLELQQTLWSL